MPTHAHDGHRDRMRNRYRAEGLDGFAAHEVIEMLLYKYVPQRNTNELAHQILAQFGSFAAVVEADEKELARIKGVPPLAAFELSMLPALMRYYNRDRFGEKPVLDSYHKAGQYAATLFDGVTSEEFYCMALDARCRLTACKRLSRGSTRAAVVSPRQVVELALLHKASAVILAHNHPGGVGAPSPSDLEMTRALELTLRAIEVDLADHVVVSGQELFSYANKRLMAVEHNRTDVSIAQEGIAYRAQD